MCTSICTPGKPDLGRIAKAVWLPAGSLWRGLVDHHFWIQQVVRSLVAPWQPEKNTNQEPFTNGVPGCSFPPSQCPHGLASKLSWTILMEDEKHAEKHLQQKRYGCVRVNQQTGSIMVINGDNISISWVYILDSLKRHLTTTRDGRSNLKKHHIM